jgi:ATP-dependent RNA helicase DDX5/DBP2
VERYRSRHDLRVFGKNIPKPVTTFQESPFPEYVLAEVYRAGYKEPTPIQAQGWPMALSGEPTILLRLSVRVVLSNCSSHCLQVVT